MVQTWYVRDASGNVMSVYSNGDNTINNGDLTQAETHLYGSSRLGIFTPNTNVQNIVQPQKIPMNGLGDATVSSWVRGNKLFELGNHLGNVLATVSDRKLQRSTNGTMVSYYEPHVVSANDYFAFGSVEPGRSYTAAGSGGYRYGFNGKENDNEVKGQGDQQDYGFRIYDPRVGRFLSTDPITKQYPWYTPYQFAGNKPIVAIDLDGLEELLSISKLRAEAAKLAVVGNKRVGELFERVAVAALSGRSVTTFSNSNINFPSTAREDRNGADGPSAVRPDLVGFSFDIDLSASKTDVRYGANQFFEVKATSATITRAYRKGQIEGMIDALSEQAKLNKDNAAELVLVATSDLKIGTDIFEYAKQKGVTLSGIIAGIDDHGQIYFSDLVEFQAGKGRSNVLGVVKQIFRSLFEPRPFEGHSGFDLKDFTNGISDEEKATVPKKDNVPQPVTGSNDPDPIEVDDK